VDVAVLAVGGAALAATALPEPNHDVAPPTVETPAPAPAWAVVHEEPAAAPVETALEFSAQPMPIETLPIETAPVEMAPVEMAQAAPVETFTETWSATPAESLVSDPEPPVESAIEPVAPPPAPSWAAASAPNPWVQVETVPGEAGESNKDTQPG
jgi:ribonuclease E